MDSGVLAEGESLEEEYDVGRDLLPEEILGIIDQLLCLEVRVSNNSYFASDLFVLILTSRWHGILGTLSHRHFLQVFISRRFSTLLQQT